MGSALVRSSYNFIQKGPSGFMHLSVLNRNIRIRIYMKYIGKSMRQKWMDVEYMRGPKLEEEHNRILIFDCYHREWVNFVSFVVTLYLNF